jgi:hypothetical protein
MLVICAGPRVACDALLIRPAPVVPPLASRAHELDHIIAEYAGDAVDRTGERDQNAATVMHRATAPVFRPSSVRLGDNRDLVRDGISDLSGVGGCCANSPRQYVRPCACDDLRQ